MPRSVPAPVVSSFAERRLSLGYRCATLVADGPLGPAGSGFRGHEFHYATIAQQESGDRLWSITDAAGTDLGMSGLRRGSVFGSFLHLIDRSGQREIGDLDRGSRDRPNTHSDGVQCQGPSEPVSK